ncbi:MAG: MFS transporter [Clostridiales bacterium]|nr:MFS transporter [Clostridiales bacterium]
MRNILKDVSIKSAVFLMAYYITNSVFQSFMALYYKDLGLNDTRIGLINAMIAMVSVFAMQFWGKMGDRAKSRNQLLAFMCVSAGVIMLMVRFVSAFWLLLLMITFFASFYTSLQPMGDSIVLESLDRAGRPFGPVRMAGGLSFAVVAMLFGNVLNAIGDTAAVVYTVAILCCLMAFAAMYLPPVAGAQKKGDKKNMLALFKSRDLLILFSFMVPLQITLGFFYAFFSPHFMSLPNANSSLLGWCYFISATSEVPFLLNADKLFKKHGAGRLMCVSALTLALRWLLVGTTTNVYVAMASQLLHFWGFIVITVTTSKYVQATVPEELKASGQLLLSVFGFGVARVIGYFGGGMLSDAVGRNTVFLICAGICVACLLIFAPYYLRRKPLNGEN